MTRAAIATAALAATVATTFIALGGADLSAGLSAVALAEVEALAKAEASAKAATS
jgi:hypothetical protein